MRWKTGLGSSRRKNSSKGKGGSESSSPSKRDAEKGMVQSVAAVSGDTSGQSAHNLGTIRVGILRPESASVCTPTPRAKRQLISELLEPDDGDVESNDHGVSASPALRSIISNKSSSGKNFDKEVGRGGSFTSYTPEEKVVFASHLNAHLLGDPFLRHLLPLDAGGADFFEKFGDGVLLCRIVCLAVPGSIADSNVNLPCGSEPLSLYKSTENLNVALKAAEEAGLQVVNIGASDIIGGRPASILGLCWQLVRVHLLAQINLKRCPDLVHLMEEREEKETFFALPVEDVLLRWFNHHLRWGGSPRRVSNFSGDLVDGYCYMSLMKELNDKFQECDFEGENPKRAQFRRACLVISGAEGIGIAPLIRPRHITGKAHLYNIAFVAQLLNRRPRIHRERLQPGAATVLQSWYRMLRVMYETQPVIESRRAAVTKIASVWRARAAVRREEMEAASTLQAWWRGVCARRKTQSFREAVAATMVQASWRGSRARREAFSKRESMASTKLQACWRGSRVRKEVLERKQKLATIEKERSASTKLQACWRGSKVRRVVLVARQRMVAIEKEKLASTKLQACWRGSRVRKEVLERKQKLATIEKERSASTKLQACWRGSRVRKEVLERKQKLATIEKERSASTKLQACWRGSKVRRVVLVARQRMVAIEKEKLASTKLQACWRGSRVRKELLERKQGMASIKLQACWRAYQGRAQATAVRRERQVTEETIAAIKRAKAVRRARLARADAAQAAELAQTMAETMKVEADAALARAQSEEGLVENAAATKLQAWARGVEIRKAMTIVREANIRGRLDSYDSSGHCILKVVPKTSLSASPRTSVASSVRSLEETDGGETSAKPSSSWFNKIFAGISFAPPPNRSTMVSPGPSTNIERGEAAVVIQRWNKKVVEGRKERMQAMAKAERRRLAVQTLHRAYFSKWRFELARKTALRKQREEAEQEEHERKTSKAKWLGAIWGDMSRSVAAAFEYKGSRDAQGSHDQSKEATDCCDAKGHAVLASEVAWKPEYVTALVVGGPGVGNAQEERAKELSRRGIDAQSWTPPENALSPAKCAIMMAALLGVALETTLSTAAASGI